MRKEKYLIKSEVQNNKFPRVLIITCTSDLLKVVGARFSSRDLRIAKAGDKGIS